MVRVSGCVQWGPAAARPGVQAFCGGGSGPFCAHGGLFLLVVFGKTWFVCRCGMLRCILCVPLRALAENQESWCPGRGVCWGGQACRPGGCYLWEGRWSWPPGGQRADRESEAAAFGCGAVIGSQNWLVSCVSQLSAVECDVHRN